MPRDREYDRLRDEMNGAWEAKEHLKQELDEAWEKLQSKQSRYGSEIEDLKQEHDDTFEEMKRAYSSASDAFESGDHDEAASESARGRDLRSELPDLVSKRRELIDKMKKAQDKHKGILDAYRDKKRQFDHAKERFDDYKAKLEGERRDIASKAGVHRGHHVKVVLKRDGKSHVYFGGRGEADGGNHGHYVLDESGNIEYRRDPNEPHGGQNYR